VKKKYDFPTGERDPKSLRTPEDTALNIPDATPLSPHDWWELIRHAAETYDMYYLTPAEIQGGNEMSTANDLRAFAAYILPVLEQIVLKK
jgi:hypothetical protein